MSSRRGWFFFSSRRRHTRYIGDWSSDVCSSDLRRAGRCGAGRAGRAAPAAEAGRRGSEERRVGKGCEFGWLAFAYKMNGTLKTGEEGGMSDLHRTLQKTQIRNMFSFSGLLRVDS